MIIVFLAISESMGLYGFVLFSLSDEFYTLYIFVALATTEMFYFHPKIEELKELATAMGSTHCACE